MKIFRKFLVLKIFVVYEILCITHAQSQLLPLCFSAKRLLCVSFTAQSKSVIALTICYIEISLLFTRESGSFCYSWWFVSWFPICRLLCAIWIQMKNACRFRACLILFYFSEGYLGHLCIGIKLHVILEA